MATKAGDITFGVGFQVDKTGLQQIQQQLQQLQSGLKTNDIAKINNQSLDQAIKTLTQIQSTAIDVEKAMNKAFNPKLGTLNLSKFQAELKDSNRTIEEIYRTFNMAGAAGQAAFRNVATQTLTANVQLKEHNKLLLDMGRTLANSFKYSISYGVLNNLTGAIQSAFQYSKSLDSSLNDIRIVTGKSADEMNHFAESANKAAKELGKSTTDYTKASLIYYQQGLADEEVETRTDVTLKAANVTGQSTAEVSEQLTAVWNGYKVSAAEAELYVDKLAAVAATTASDLEELSTGMSKVASAANAMGVDIDQLNGMLSTIVSVTRQAPESAGTALKTIFARMGDLELNGEDEFGVSLGKVSGALDSVGVKILDTTGNLRDMGKVIEEVGNKWNTGAWTNAEKQAIAIELAGKRQYNNLLALFDNWDMYNKAVETSMEAQGTLQKQQDVYMESTAAHLQQMQTAWEGVKDSILKPADINPVIDSFTKFAETTETIIDSVGGLQGILTIFGSVALQAFGPMLGQSLAGVINNFGIARQQANALNTELQMTQQLKNSTAYQNDEGVKFLVDEMEKLQAVYGNIDEAQANMHKKLLETASEAKNTTLQYEAMADAAARVVNAKNNGQTNYKGKDLLDNNLWDKVNDSAAHFEMLADNIQEVSDLLKQDGSPAAEDFSEKLTLVAEATEAFGKNDPEINELVEIIVALGNKADRTEEETKQLAQAFDTLGSRAKSLHEQMSKVGSDMGSEYAQSVQTYVSTTNALKESTQNLSIQNMTAQFATAVGSITQVSMGITSLSSAIQQFKDGQEGSFINLTVGLASLARGYQELAKTLGITESIWSVIVIRKKADELQTIATTNAKAAQVAMEKLGNEQDKKQVKEIAEKIIAKKLNIETMTEEKLTEEANTLAGEKATAVTMQQVAAIRAEVKARRAQTESTEAAELANDKLNKSLLKNPYLIAGAIIIGVIAGIGRAVHNYNKELRENRIEANNEKLELIRSNLDKAESNKALGDSYDELYRKYQQTHEDSTELREQSLELCDTYGLEAEKILALTGRYEELNDVIQKSTKGDIIKTLKEIREGKQAALANLKDQAYLSSEQDGLLFDTYMVNAQTTSRLDAGLTTLDSWTNGDNAIQKLLMSEQGYHLTQGGDVEKTYANVKELYEGLEKDLKAIEESGIDYSGSDIYNNLKKRYTEMRESYDAYIEFIDAERQAEIQQFESMQSQALDSYNELQYSEKNFEQFVKTSKELKDYLISTLGLDENEAQELVDSYITGLNNVFSARYDKLKNFAEDSDEYQYLKSLTDEEFAILVGVGFASSQDKATLEKLLKDNDIEATVKVTLEDVAGVREGIMDKKLTKKEAQAYQASIAGVSEVAGVEMSGFQSAGKVSQMGIVGDVQNAMIQEMVDSYTKSQGGKNSERYKELEEAIKTDTAAAEELQQKIDEYTLELQNQFRKDEEWTAEVAEGEYKTAKEISDRLSELERKSQRELTANEEHELQALKQIQKEYFDEFGTNLNEAQSAYDSLTAAVNRYKTTQEELTSDTYWEDAMMEAMDAMDQSINTTIDDLHNLYNATSLIGEGWKVAASDVEKFSQLYPELLEGATVEAEGEIQLRQDVVNARLEAIQAEKQAETQAQIDELELRNQMIDLENEYLDAQIEALQEYLEKNQDADKLKRTMEANYNEYAQNLNGLLAQNQIDNINQGTQANTNAAKTVLDNINALQKAYYELGASAALALAGQAVGKMSTGVSLSSTKLSAYEDKKKTLDESKQDDYQAAIDALSDFASKRKANDSEKASNTGKIALLKSSLSQASDSINKVKAGKAGKSSNKSSSSKESEDKKQLLKLEDEIDLYREVNEQLEEVDHNLKMLQKQEDRTYGAQHIENLKAQSAELAKQQKLIEKKLGLTKQDLAMRQKLLSAQGVQFGADGDISNYQALLTEKINNINALYTQYNNTLDKALKSTIKTQADNAKEEYESLKKSIEAYEKLQDQMDQLNEQWQDARNAEIDKQIEAFNYRIDLDLNVAKATKRWNEFKRKVVDDMENIADPVKKVIEQMKAGIEDYRTTYSAGGEVAINTGAVRETLDQFNQMMATGTASIYGNNPAQLVADLEKRKEDLMKSVEDAEQMIADMRKMYLDGLDEAYDKMEKHTDQYEYISNLIEHDINLIELLRGEEAYEDMGRYYDRQAQNNIKNVEFLRMQRDALREQVDSLEKDSKAWKKVYQQLQDTEMELRDSVNESVQLLLDRYENGLNKILKDLDKKVSGGMGVDYLQEQYEMQQDLADNYLDSVNQAYALEKLRAKFTKAINDTTDIKAREKLTNLLHEQVDALAEKEKLAQYEVDHAEKMLEVEQARIALEEAQANKSQMRLKRDNQGNYSYQYVADEDAIDDAQQDLLDAENDLWNFDVGGLRTAREEAIKIWQEYFEKLREIWEDTSLTEEERQQKLLDLDNWRTGELEANVEKYNFFKTNTEQDANTILADLYSQNADEFGRVVMEEILPDWNSGVDSMIEKYAGEGIPACQEALAQLQANTEEYRTKVDELAEAAGMDFDEICNGIDMTIDYTYSLMNTNEEMIDQYRREMDELNELNRILEDVQREFQAARDEAIRMAQEATNAIQRANELRAASEAAKAAADAAAAAASQSSYYSGGSSGGGSGSGSSGGQTSSGGSSSSDTGRNYKVVGYDERGISITIYDKTLREAQEIMEQYNRRGGKTRVAHYDTGGYTGDWHSSEGKVAMLHEKELVLNKHDTENMLDAVNVVRHIVASLDGSMLGRLADMSALAFNSITPGIETSNETLEQNVHIEASFPNATNRNEIEEAFNNLVNIASQKALNTRR